MLFKELVACSVLFRLSNENVQVAWFLRKNISKILALLIGIFSYALGMLKMFVVIAATFA